MSITGISMNSVPQQSNTVRGTINQWRQGFGQLSDALQAGDLSGAQAAYKSLLQLHQSNAAGRPPGSGNPTLQSDFAALGKALGSGDLNASQSAFNQLHTDMHAAKTQWLSTHNRPDVSATPTTVDSDGDSDGSTGNGVGLYA